jgi:hypothetical protein
LQEKEAAKTAAAAAAQAEALSAGELGEQQSEQHRTAERVMRETLIDTAKPLDAGKSPLIDTAKPLIDTSPLLTVHTSDGDRRNQVRFSGFFFCFRFRNFDN